MRTEVPEPDYRALTAAASAVGGTVIDDIIPEPVGGAHRDPKKAAMNLERWIIDQIIELKAHNPSTLPKSRYERFRKLGSFVESR